MTTNAQAKVLFEKARRTQGLLTPTETLMLAEYAEEAYWLRQPPPKPPEYYPPKHDNKAGEY